MAGTFAFDGLNAEFTQVYDPAIETEVPTYYIVTSMRIERYYASIKDETSRLSDDAITLLNGRDYIGFFKACGPSYVRGIRRAQEVTTSIKFTSTSAEAAANFASGLNSGGGASVGDGEYNAVNQSLQISIKGYGLSLTDSGSDVFMAKTLAELDQVMAFAFKTMVSNPNAVHIGMVQGMEVVPWVNNIKFQVAANVNDEVIEIPIPKSILARAYKITDNTDFSYTTATRAEFTCKNPASSIDKYGYCCGLESMYDFVGAEYNMDTPEDRACRPIRTLDKSIVKENLSNNGEFVARLDSALRSKVVKLSTLQTCVSAVNGIPTHVEGNYLISHASSLDSADSARMTVFDMKQAMDPFGDMGMVKQLGKELDEFISMFYAPCLSALFGANAGTSSETDATYFMAYPWYTHTECGYMSCLAGGMRWDRKNGGGCVPGMAAGPGAESYESTGDDSESSCDKDTESGGDTEVCKDSTASLVEFQARMNTCWSTGGIETFLTSYCMPKVSNDVMPDFDTYKASIDCNAAASTASWVPPRRTRELSAVELGNKGKKQELARRKLESKRRTEERRRRRVEEVQASILEEAQASIVEEVQASIVEKVQASIVEEAANDELL